jgi:hypothetical protein
MPTHAPPVSAPPRPRPARRIKAARTAGRIKAARTAGGGPTAPGAAPLPTAANRATPYPAQPGPGPARLSPVALRRARLIALAVGSFLLPWCVVLGVTLPATAQAQHWPAAWVGLDAGEAIAALATAVLLARGDARAGLTAAAGGALLLTDAWFDVCTCAPGFDQAVALTEAILVELPLAGAAFWLAVRLTRGRPA